MRRRLPDILIIVLLFCLPLVMFWQQTIGGRTLLPTENIYQYEPYATYREVVKAPDVPHNALLSDLVLQNYQWKMFIRESIAQREIPLWNPYQFSGIPFLAAGQQSTLYPFSLLYYVMPLWAAYGWFTVVQLWLAGAFMYGFLRGLNVGRFGSTIAGVTYQLSAFFVISAVFPMIIAAAAWLPLLLLMIEFTIQQRMLFGRPTRLPWVAIGAVALGCMILAGHVEITYHTLLIMGYYAAARLLVLWWLPVGTQHAMPLRDVFISSIWLIGMIILGMALGAVQFIPLFELAGVNFRAGSASYEQVVGWAHPLRDLLQFALPNFYGNPTHHSYVDVFTRETIPVTVNALGNPNNHTDWGIKNYVEAALYVGILPLALAGYAVVLALIPGHQLTQGERDKKVPRPQGEGFRLRAIIFLILVLLGLTFMFGLPTYHLLYLLPGIDQLHSPFRWIFSVTLSVAVLAGFGADHLEKARSAVRTRSSASLQRWFAYGLLAAGAFVLVGLLVSYVFFGQIEPLVEQVLSSMALADRAFADARMFYSYQFTNGLVLGVMLLGAGVIFYPIPQPEQSLPVGPPHTWRGGAGRANIWRFVAVGLVAVDLMIASWGFNPASDPLLLDFTPPAIEWLQNQPGDWRYTTLEDPTQPPIMNANLGWQHGLRDIRGYESIIPKQYVDYMEQIAPQRQLEFNRVAPLYVDQLDSVDWNRLWLLGVRYIMTAPTLNLYDYLPQPVDPRTGNALPPPAPVFEDASLRIWERPAMPHAYVAQLLAGDELHIEGGIFTGWEVVIDIDTGREKVLHVNVSDAVPTSWLVINETYMPGWRAFIRPRGSADDLERPLPVARVLENFQGVDVSPGVIQNLFNDLSAEHQAALEAGQVTIRLVYSPSSFQVGLFVSFIGAVLVIFMLGVWLWRLFVARQDDNPIGRVARNSVAPIILNLFNRGIDFAFAFVMLRILGPEDAGIYFYAGFIFIWFDIFTNFGLDVYLTREVARDRSRAARYFISTSALRLGLTLVGVALLALFLLARQNLIAPPLSMQGVIAIILLYIGLLPGSLSKGMTSLFYAFEQAEYPAAITTLSTISKTVFGLAALVLGYGVIGLAGVSILTNALTLAVLLWGGRKLLSSPSLVAARGLGGEVKNSIDIPLIRRMTGESWPLLVNHFLATIFFQIDILIIEAIHGARMVGLYSVAYKWIAALNIIPAFFTQAMLPIMSRQAHEDRDALKRTYILAIKLLVSLALPTAVIFTFLAFFLTNVLGGAQYLPDGAIATQLMIWSIPIGWINSLTQYVLIALDLQRRITRAFMIAVTFNIVSNMLFIPQYGYQAAALTTIASELMLLLPFGLLLHGALGMLPWLQMIWRPGVATALMIVVMQVAGQMQPALGLLLGILVYAATLLMLRPLNSSEIARLKPLLPRQLAGLAR